MGSSTTHSATRHAVTSGRPAQQQCAALAAANDLAALVDRLVHEGDDARLGTRFARPKLFHFADRSEEHTSELQSLMRISYAVFCLKKKIEKNPITLSTLNTYHSNISLNNRVYS